MEKAGCAVLLITLNLPHRITKMLPIQFPISWVLVAVLGISTFTLKGCYDDAVATKETAVAGAKVEAEQAHAAEMAALQHKHAQALGEVTYSVNRLSEQFEHDRYSKAIESEQYQYELQKIIKDSIYDVVCYNSAGVQLANKAAGIAKRSATP